MDLAGRGYTGLRCLMMKMVFILSSFLFQSFVPQLLVVSLPLLGASDYRSLEFSLQSQCHTHLPGGATTTQW